MRNKTPANPVVPNCMFCLKKIGAGTASRDSNYVKLHRAEYRRCAEVSKSGMRFTRVDDRSGNCGTKPKVNLPLKEWEALFREMHWRGMIRGQPVTRQKHTPTTPSEA